jgi:hypothetical protein
LDVDRWAEHVQWDRLLGCRSVDADEGGEDFHDGGLVQGGVAQCEQLYCLLTTSGRPAICSHPTDPCRNPRPHRRPRRRPAVVTALLALTMRRAGE